MKTIEQFDGEYRFLSNFYQVQLEYEGLTYPCAENAYQAAKTMNMKARKIFTLQEVTPGMAKHLGQAITLRPNWDTIKFGVMNAILEAKFSNPTLRALLWHTGDAELIEGNNWGDTFWGVCNGKGSNFLGKALMDLRKKLTMPSA